MNKYLRTFSVMPQQKYLLLMLVLFSLMHTRVHGAREVFNVRSGGSIGNSTNLTVSDDQYGYMQAFPSGASSWSNSFTNAAILNRIILSIDHSNTAVQAAYTATVTLQVTYYTWSTASNSFVANQLATNPVLTISYNPSSAYTDKTVYQFAGGNQCVVNVVSITSTAGVVINNMVLEAEVDITRYYAFSATQPITAAYNDLNSTTGELEVYWDYVPGAEEYDLEWTYINDYDITGSTLPASQITIDNTLFRFNSSRITTTNTYFRIPLIYERGYILYRVRAVGLSATDLFQKNLYGNWSSDATTFNTVAQFPNTYYSQGHEPQLNWQNSVSFAENAKKKAVVSYYDGSLRNRQVVSKMNSTNQIIVGETIYDFQGRAAVQVLPVPVTDQIISYQPSFNVNQNGVPYSKSDFDLDVNCKVSTAPMDSTSGAFYYYSSVNADKNGQQAYVPNAKGYPFTQVEYTPDNTGRIRAQSGVGKDHILGSGHESKYFYAVPMQEELDRMFGGEAGDATHYKKNMVIDANGQISVSYLDPQGRVIATALAGASPSQLEDLGADSSTVYVDLLNNGQQLMNNDSLVLTEVLAVSSNGQKRTINYSLTSAKFVEQCQLVNNINQSINTNCYDCVMDLSIILTDECGTNYLLNLDGVNPNSTTTTVGSNILAQMRQGTNVYSSTGDCNQPNLTFSKSWQNAGPLPVGTYTISKVLKVNEEALDSFQTNYLRSGSSCVLTLTSFLNAEISKMDTSGCTITCASCLASVGPYSQYSGPNCTTCLSEDDYSQLIASCNSLCDTLSIDCSSALNLMQIDVGPFGQYGSIDTSNYTANNYPLSVFNNSSTNVLSHRFGFTPNWKHPLYLNVGTNGQIISFNSNYINDTGAVVYVPIQYNPNAGNGQNSYTPAIDAGAAQYIVKDASGNLYIGPQYLTNFTDFFALWDNSWAQSLVVYHPEYPDYLFCVANNPSHDFDYAWLQATTVNEAPAGYMNPLGSSPSTSIDPYFNPVVQPGYYDANEYVAMNYFMNHYGYVGNKIYSIWQMAYATANCPDFSSGSANNCGNISFCGENITSSSSFGDAEWAIYKTMYYSLKQSFYQNKLEYYSIGADSYNGCIGDSTFDITRYNFLDVLNGDTSTTTWPRNAIIGPSQYFNPNQPCSWMFRSYYADKTKRFVSQNDLVSSSINTNACDTSLSGKSYPGLNCPAVQQQIADNTQAQAEAQFYKTCGQCPIVLELTDLLDAIVNRTSTELTSNFQLSCYPENKQAFQEFVPDIETALNLSGTGPVFWQTNAALTSSTMVTANFVRQSSIGNTAVTNPVLVMTLYSSYMLPDNSTSGLVAKSFTLSDIQDFCCMQYETQPSAASGLPVVPGASYFTINATVTDQTVPRKIIMEGYITQVSLSNCPIPTICTTTTAGANLQDFLNMLLYQYPASTAGGTSFPAQNPVLLTNGTQVLLDQNVTLPGVPPTIYETTITPALIQYGPGGGGSTWNWSSTVSTTANTTLTGVIQASNNGTATGTSLVELTLPSSMPGGAGFSNIVSFTAIRNNPTAVPGVNAANNFLIDALVQYGNNQQQYVTLTGYTSTIPVSTCQQAVYQGN